jgi:hypothetical protein
MKTYERVNVYIHVILTSPLFGGEMSASRCGRFTPEERALCTYWIGGWVDSSVCLDSVERKIFDPTGLEIRPLTRPARS